MDTKFFVAGKACMIENFIYVKENSLSDEICDELISEITRRGELADRSNQVKNGNFGDEQFANGKFGRHDFQVFMPQQTQLKMKEISDCIFDGLEEYKHVIPSASGVNLISEVQKIQHTPVGGGFHEWHCEQGGGWTSARSLVWMIYLNDVSGGGDTEFLYQQIKVQPKKGTLVIWPAGITHPHRGNPPYSNDKYIVTGWFEHPIYDVYHKALTYFKASEQL